jgi:hypothetical protein
VNLLRTTNIATVHPYPGSAGSNARPIEPEWADYRPNHD